jgi:ABC-type Fe3+/spermidine/putrescine transport system ATPase subunit
MSGGQQQRVALARSLAVEPHVILFDEPLSNVDAKLRDQLRLELALMQRRLRFSGVYVTHDQIEALQLADLVAVMGNGRIHQLGTPREVYGTPVSKYVATFVGQANELPGKVIAVKTGNGGADVVAETALGSIQCSSGKTDWKVGDAISVIVRPENLQVSEKPNGRTQNCWKATIEATIFSGTYSEYKLSAGDAALFAWSSQRNVLAEQKEVFVCVDPAEALVFPGEG